MKSILLSFLLLPFVAGAQVMPAVVPQVEKHPLLEGFAEVGYVHELWVVSDKLSYGYSSLSYTGSGFYAGGGIRSRMDDKRPLGFGVSVDYLQYTMGSSLKTNVDAPTDYGYARIAPMVYYTFKTKSELTFTARGDVGVMAAIRNNEKTYVQLGLHGCVGYKAYEANIGFNFSQADKVPVTGVNSKWHEQQFTLGLACYPARIKFIKHHEPKPAITKWPE